MVMSPAHVWIVHRPDYGDHNGLPVAVFIKKGSAAKHCQELNEPWKGARLRGKPIKPYKCHRMEIKQ